MRTEAGARFRACAFDGSMFAGHYAAGDQQLSSSRWQIKTQRILLSTGMRLTQEPSGVSASEVGVCL